MFRPKYACVRQTDQSDCGPACLATVVLHYGRAISREALREAAGTDKAGTNLAGMKKAAERLGFSAKALKGDKQGLKTVPLPCVLHVKNTEGLGHYVVLHAFKGEHLLVADPAHGLQEWTNSQLDVAWTGYVLVLAPTHLSANTLAEAVPPWRRLWDLVAAQRDLLAEAYLCALLMAVLGIGSSLFVQHLVDGVLSRGDTQLLNAFGWGMVLVLIFRVIFGAARHYLMAWLGRQAGLSLISHYTRHLLRLPMRFFEARRVGEILSRVQDAAKIRDAVSGLTMTLVVDSTLLLFAAAALLLADLQLALVAGAFVPILLVAVLAHHPFARRRAREAMENGAKLSSHLIEDVSGVEAVKNLSMEAHRSDRADDLLAATGQSAFGLQKLAVSMTSAAMLVTGAAQVAVLWYGSYRVLDGAISLGQLLFVQSLLGYLLQPLERLAGVNLQLQDALVAVDRLYQILELAPEPQERAGHAQVVLGAGIELNGVHFRYGSRAPVLKDINLVIPAGKTVALVGESGSGKSTLLKLLQRFHDPTEGQILVGGTDLRDLGIQSWRGALGVVPQEPAIFSGSLRDNLVAGNSAVTRDMLEAAVRTAGLHEVIAQLPDRWDTVLGERGANLSGGQKQRIALARALLRQPQVLLFDEATSHLDTTTELAIQRQMESFLVDKTAVVVAHRLSTVYRADLIVVLHQGQIVEQGTHAELLDKNGRYAALWRAQTAANVVSLPPRTQELPALEAC